MTTRRFNTDALTRSASARLIAQVFVVAALMVAVSGPASAQLSWPAVTREAKPWTRWWWLGSAVDSAGISAQLRELSRAGFGGVEVTSIYGARGAELAYVPYLSPQWVALLAHTADEAHRLGMGVDVPPGSGWRLGGPRVPASDANASIQLQPPDAATAAPAYTASMRFSGDDVKRPAPGGEGKAIDVFSRAATTHYLEDFAEHTRALPAGAIGSFFHDSFEYTGNGSDELFDTFAVRRGYDLRTELAAFAGRGDPDRVARVKSDYRQTLSDMLVHNFLGTLVSWSHARGSTVREQAHGSPGNLLDLYAATDIPETEIFGPLGSPDANPLINKFASSAAHLAGRALASAESFTWLGEHFSAPLDDVKQAADGLFLTGINHLVYHGTAYSPSGAAWPGWEFYASAEFNPRNAFWRDLPALNQFVTRVQSVMQSGHTDADVLLYWPIWDNWHDTAGMRIDFTVQKPLWLADKPVGAVASTLWNTGYSFDYVSDALLEERVSVRKRRGRLQAADAGYAALLVPRTDHMPADTFDRLVALAREGATVIFVDRLPDDVPGLAQLDQRRAALAMAKRQLIFTPDSAQGVRRANVGTGRVLVGADLGRLLAAAGVQRDPLAGVPNVRFLRQRGAHDGRQYFVKNQGATTIDTWVTATQATQTVAVLNPMDGLTGLARIQSRAGRRAFELQLEPGQSLIVETFGHATTGAPWRYIRIAAAPTPVRGRWRVDFIEGGPTLPKPFEANAPLFWTDRGDADADRFAGTARYTVEFDAPDRLSDHLLDFGRVSESVHVRLNGRDLGTLIARPFQVRTGRLRPTANRLEIEVTNLSANRIRDLDRREVSWRIFRDINYVNLAYKPFDASGWPIRSSGLSGPVTLTPLGAPR